MTLTVTNRTGPGPVGLRIVGAINAELADEVAAALAMVDGRELEVHVDSPGGDYKPGRRIYDLLRGHSGDVTTRVDSYAASAATMIVLAGRRRVMRHTAHMLIHDPSLNVLPGFGGPAHVLEQVGETMGRLAGNLADLYADRTGVDSDWWRQKMVAETTFTASAAHRYGLATEVDYSSEPVRAAYGPPAVIRCGAPPSPFDDAGGVWSVFDPRWRTRLVHNAITVASMSAALERRDADRRLATRIDYHHAGYWLGYKHPLVQTLARSN